MSAAKYNFEIRKGFDVIVKMTGTMREAHQEAASQAERHGKVELFGYNPEPVNRWELLTTFTEDGRVIDSFGNVKKSKEKGGVK